MRSCRACGGRLRDAVSWCSVCFAPADPSPPPAPDPLLALRVGSRWVAPERTTAPPPPKVHSRWREGPLSFGLTGRVLGTLVCALAMLWFLSTPFVQMAPLPLKVPFAFLPGLVLSGVVRELWRRRRVE